jgi:hypothetical protein
MISTTRQDIKNLKIENPPTNGDDGKTIDDAGSVVRRMFADSKEAHSAYRGLRKDNSDRNRKNAAIQRKLNNEPPFKEKSLAAAGQKWRSNRPTGLLSTMIARIKPGYKKTLLDAPVLTFSRFPGTTPEAEAKTDAFRLGITSHLRGWDGWDDFVSSIINENVTFGYTAATWESEYDWRPTWMRQDEVFFETEASKDINRHVLWARFRRYPVHELMPIVDNPVSGEVGYNIKNVIKAINDAQPPNRAVDGDDDARRYEDQIRETSIGASYLQEGKFVELGQLVVAEPTGKISVFLFTDKDGDEIFTGLDMFDSMSDLIAVWSVEDGSGPLMTSRGAGRDLFNTHIAVDKARNLIWDNFYLSGLLLLKKGENAMPGTAPLQVLHPIGYVGKGYDVQDQQIPANPEAFLALDNHAVSLAEQQLGVFLPGQTDVAGSTRTASEVNYVASIDAQIREGILSRFFFQSIRCVNQIQRRICHPEHVMAAKAIFDILGPNGEWAPKEVVAAFERARLPLPENMVAVPLPEHLDESAVRCCLSMMVRGLRASDIIIISQSPAHNLTQDDGLQARQGIGAVAAKYTGNPRVNQQELIRRDISSIVGGEVADKLVIAEDDQTIALEAVRQQTHELNDMLNGLSVPVSPRDPDQIHLDTLAEKFAPILQTALQGQVMLPGMDVAFGHIVQHMSEHIEQMISKGAPPEETAPYEQALAGMQQMLSQLSAGPNNVPPESAPLGPGVAPAAEMATDAPPMPPMPGIPPAPMPMDSVINNASPVRPTPPSPGEVAQLAMI